MKLRSVITPLNFKVEQSANGEHWILYVQDGRHNYQIGIYLHGHAQVTE